MLYQDIIAEFKALENPTKAKLLSGFFKTDTGQYGEGDLFLGIIVPVIRKITKKYIHSITLEDIEQLLCSSFHEIRLSGVLFLVEKFKKADTEEQSDIFNFYLAHTKYINNWDLVDLSAPHIIGAYLRDKNRDILNELAHSPNLWEQRISVIATFFFIKNGEHSTSFSIIETLLSHKHDLIHKANGWMLREIGKRCGEEIMESFLLRFYPKIPRTTLRNAVERLDLKRKNYWMKYEGK